MASEVVMPQMGADMVEGTIVRWLKQEGDAVTRGEVIAEIETDKANVEIEAFDSGVFRKAIHGEGDTVPVGTLIAVIAAADEDIAGYSDAAAPTAPAKAPTPGAAPSPVAAAKPVSERPPTPAPPPVVPEPRPVQQVAEAPAENGRVRVSPVARRMAIERGIDLRRIRGSGPDGRIVKRDVEQQRTDSTVAASSSATTTASATAIQPTKMRQAIARRMAQSKREAPHYYLLLDVDMTEAMAFRSQANASLAEDERISINDLIVRATALALQHHPQFNATITGDQVTEHGQQHVCIAIAMDEGLIAPAIVDAGNKSLREIAVSAKDLAARAKGGSLRAEEITAGTFTITNLGAYGVEVLIGIIQPPQTAILGAGSVLAQPAVRDGVVVARQLMKVALAADHRVTDGAEGARFLGEIKRLLEQPMLLVL